MPSLTQSIGLIAAAILVAAFIAWTRIARSRATSTAMKKKRSRKVEILSRGLLGALALSAIAAFMSVAGRMLA